MKISISLSICFILIIITSSSSPEQTVTIKKTSCTFTYNWNNQHFNFRFCSNQTHQIYTWPLCFQQCCPHIQLDSSPPNYYTLLQCQEKEDTYAQLVVILASTLGGIVTVGIAACCLVACCRCNRPRNRVVHDTDSDQVEWLQENNANTTMQDLKWSTLAHMERSLPLKEDPCAICLENDTNAELFCRHQFHPKCIGGWLRKSSNCPCCRMTNIRGIKVYCQVCRWRYYVCTRTLIIIAGNRAPQRCQKCDGKIFSDGPSEMVLKFQQSHQALARSINS